MVQHVVLEEPTCDGSDSVELQHEVYNSLIDEFSFASQKGKGRLMPFESQSLRQSQHIFDVNGYSSLAIAVPVDTRSQHFHLHLQPVLTSMRKDVLALGLTLMSLIEDATLSTHDCKSTFDARVKSIICDSIPVSE